MHVCRYDNFLLENAEPKGSTSVPLERLTDLVKSLGGDYKWMKDKEIEVCRGSCLVPVPSACPFRRSAC